MSTPSVSPLAPAAFPDLPMISGVRFASVAAGVRYQGRTDVMLAVLDPGSVVAGVFTRSATRSAAVLDCQDKIGGGGSEGAAILVNSGNANTFTGRLGREAVAGVTGAVAQALGLPSERVFTSSTGVIGEPMDWQRITTRLDDLQAGLDAGNIAEAARAIMTTDTFPKGAARVVTINGTQVKIAGIAKGSGMIAPDMATMLVYIFTDAQIGRADLQALVSDATDRTFNCITVDSDTSTSDTLLVAATGKSDVDVTGNADFAAALEEVMLDLALQVVRDGEGATKLLEVQVEGATDDADARKVALSIANSPLVKTAVAGEDANWGRVVMAVGKSGAVADRDRLAIRFGDMWLARDGARVEDYSEDAASAYMKGQELVIGVDLGLGDGRARMWTCDLTHGYIAINADYRS